MEGLADSRNGSPFPKFPRVEGDIKKRAQILDELNQILESQFFRKSERGKQFLRYVVTRALEGQAEALKERTIGVELFHRPADYATGEDPVVRVQAGEVRRRLEQYYQSSSSEGAVRIELPVGSYAPEFRWKSPPIATHVEEQDAPRAVIPPPAEKGPRLRYWIVLGLCASVVVALVATKLWPRSSHVESVTQQFWAPVFSTRQPVLICLAKGVTYRPGMRLYQLYERTHPGAFQTEVQRSNDPLQLPDNQQISWGDMELFDEYGVAGGDVSAALRVSAFLGSVGKPLQVRIGGDYSFADLRKSPAVVIGAYNNKWTSALTSGLHFTFAEEPGKDFLIREQAPGSRIWRTAEDQNGEATKDYGIVTRLLDSKTGQFTVTIAGIRARGTEAAGELISGGGALEDALKSAPRNWPQKNLQIVFETDVTDSVAGPPHVVATYYW